MHFLSDEIHTLSVSVPVQSRPAKIKCGFLLFFLFSLVTISDLLKVFYTSVFLLLKKEL